LTFQDAQLKLLAYVRSQIRNGELTERGFARSVGISQPHVHNVLKGVRNLSPEFFDLALKYFHLNMLDLVPLPELEAHLRNRRMPQRSTEVPFLDAAIGPGMPWPIGFNSRQKFPLPFSPAAVPSNLVMAALIADPAMPSIAPYDVALLDTSPSQLAPQSLFVIERNTEAGREALLRYIRPGAQRYYLATDVTLDAPADWEPLPLSTSDLAAAVKARVRWLGNNWTGNERDLDPQIQRGRFLYDPISS
jgi:hypothetical protein